MWRGIIPLVCRTSYVEYWYGWYCFKRIFLFHISYIFKVKIPRPRWFSVEKMEMFYVLVSLPRNRNKTHTSQRCPFHVIHREASSSSQPWWRTGSSLASQKYILKLLALLNWVSVFIFLRLCIILHNIFFLFRIYTTGQMF